jgi:gluconolactonase
MRAATFVLLVCACNGGAVDATGSSSSGSSGAGESSGEPSSSSSSSGASMGGSEESGSPTTGAPVDPTACWTDLEVGAQEFFFNGFVGGSEGISFGADGLLYVTADAEVWRLDAAGEASVFAEVAAPVGLARLADGGFIVAGFGASRCSRTVRSSASMAAARSARSRSASTTRTS